MFLNPAQVTIGQMRLLNQLQELQSAGYLANSSMDFGRELETNLVSLYQSLSDPGTRAPLLPGARLWSDAYGGALKNVIDNALRFRPIVAADFPPLQSILPKGRSERPCPVVVEKATYDEAMEVVRCREGRAALDEYAVFNGHESMEMSVFLMRGWEGEVHALAINALHPDGDTKTMMCCRDLKFDRNKRSAFRGVGVLLTMARLLYMKRAGYWTEAAPILRDIYPQVLTSYRKLFPAPPSARSTRGEWHIDVVEAERMIHASPFNIAELPMSPAS
jgi:hypothetical protein